MKFPRRLQGIVKTITAFVIVTVLTLVNTSAQSQWFDKREKAQYRLPSGKWRDAAIEISPGQIEVFSRKDRVSIAKFTQAVVKSQEYKKNRGKQAGIIAASGFGTLIGAYFLAKQDEGTVVVRDDQVYTKGVNTKALGIIAGAIVGITAAVGISKSKETLFEIKHEHRSIQLKVSKDDQIRLKESLRLAGPSFSVAP